MRFFTKLGRGLLAATLGATTLAALHLASPVHAQYTTYPQTQPAYAQTASPQGFAQPVAQGVQQAQQPAPQQAYAPPAVSQPAYNPQQTAPMAVYSQYAPSQGYNPARPGVASMPYGAAGQNAAPPQAFPQQQVQQQPQQYVAPYAAPRMAMAYQTPAATVDNLPLTAPAENVAAGAIQNGGYVPQPMAGGEYASAQGYGAAPGAMASGAAAGAGCNCQANGYESYPGETSAYGACNVAGGYGCEQPGTMARVLGKHGGGYWFGGVYGLLMDRDSTNKYPLTFAGPSYAPGDYPSPDAVVLSTRDVDTDFQGGVEFRLGRVFGGGANPCGGCACGPTWGLEAVYWTLFENNEYAEFVDDATVRTYSMMPTRGLFYDPGSGALPVNDFWDYGTPVPATNTIVVTRARASSSFEVNNIELNLLRLSLCGNACGGPAMCNVGCDSGSCDTCATGGCDGGQCATGYGAGRGRFSRFSCTGVCGVRYLEIDESFMYGVDYFNTATSTAGFLDYHAQTENKLVGAQLGCNGIYRIGCKWGVHMNTLVGVYGNDIDVRQYFNNPVGGQVQYSTGEDFDVYASKTDVSMLGEVRLGASYQATCHLRLYGGWRALGITGLALASDQAPNAFLNASQLSNYVNSNGSLILHGLQTGVEWNY